MRQPEVCKHQVCDHCGGRFGMVTHRWWGNKLSPGDSCTTPPRLCRWDARHVRSPAKPPMIFVNTDPFYWEVLFKFGCAGRIRVDEPLVSVPIA
jgi:hypothetical protein